MTPLPETNSAPDDPRLAEDEVIEVSFLLTEWQMSALERAAYHRGLTAAEMVRQLLRDFIADRPTPC